ncbi:hypothetical protein HETIRDRAFT_101940 [Heterobasidion irregulare TC 32-1]|uniref:Uncharacterized protein n=1 Tax=Heterobasidion irregulare (strain TC 32-1) TaxID=747525 RepID=W4K4V8_HETIT|nr:uncharacterized protein HETIRDRAFT_101940 [Heterobasidion irregulare TC 32-1]ETW80853.1 hypothetical protein HETIRDRAFT_101940 [Heterobasidion irregulare TC 32-1]
MTDPQTSPSSATAPTHPLLAVNPSESASLKGHKAKTPIIAGVTTAGCLLLAWLVLLFLWLRKRCRRRRRIRAGLAPVPTRDDDDEDDERAPVRPKSTYIIPPDPAVLAGLRRPGEVVVGEPTVNGHRHGHGHGHGHDARPQAEGDGVAIDEGAIAGEEKHTGSRHSARGAFRAFASST